MEPTDQSGLNICFFEMLPEAQLGTQKKADASYFVALKLAGRLFIGTHRQVELRLVGGVWYFVLGKAGLMLERRYFSGTW